MRVLSLGLAMALAIATGAYAADYGSPVDSARWDGFYGGLHAGYGSGSFDGCGTWGNPAPPVSWPPPCASGPNDFSIYGPFNGALFGGQIGYNAQWDSFVLGGEVALSLPGLTHNNNLVGPPPGPLTMSLSPLASATVHAGFAFDKVFVYGLVGYGGGHVSHNNGSSGCAYETNASGLVYGGGAQILLSNDVSIFGEYNRLDFGAVDAPCMAGATAVNNRFTTQANIFKVGINKFFR